MYGARSKHDYELIERKENHVGRALPSNVPLSKYYKGNFYELAGQSDGSKVQREPHEQATGYKPNISEHDERGSTVQEAHTSTTSNQDIDPLARPKSRLRWPTSGWRFSISGWTALCIAVLVINASLTIAVSKHQGGFQHGLGTLYRGDCKTTQYYNTGLHVVINILSTSLLAGSNFCMQCLSAPTREEVDEAHSRRIALDIGVPSFKNLAYIRKRKLVLWLLLGLSSVPLHLFYNSVVHASISFNDYSTVWATSDFMNSSLGFEDHRSAVDIAQVEDSGQLPYAWDIRGLASTPWPGARSMSEQRQQLAFLRAQMSAGYLKRLTPTECVRTYGQSYVTAGNVILVPSQGTSLNTTVISYHVVGLDHSKNYGDVQVMRWLCEGALAGEEQQPILPPSLLLLDICRNHIPGFLADIDSWHPGGRSIDHCLLQATETDCRLLFSLPVALIIIALNCTKALLMFVTAFKMDADPLLTIGDAFRSFLAVPDAWTLPTCPANPGEFQKRKDEPRLEKLVEWSARRDRLNGTPGWRRWLQIILPWLTSLAACAGLLAHGMEQVTYLRTVKDARDAFSLGFSSAHSETIITSRLPSNGAKALLGNVIMANSPQIIFSIIYFGFNAFFTTLCTSLEWAQLPLKRKGLRVSAGPKGKQRTTYFLGLPYRYSLPLLVASSALHWLISQAIYLLALDRRSLDLTGKVVPGLVPDSRDGQGLIYTCGWSPLAVLLVIVVGISMMCVTVGIGFRKLPTAMPVGANNSLVLAAACHPNKEEGDGLEYKKLKWGVVKSPGGNGQPGHCALSARDPPYPEAGQLYA